MKNLFRMFAAVVVAAAALSCEKVDVNEEKSGEAAVITFTADFAATKTGFDAGKLTWEAGDKIAVCDGETVEVVSLKAENIKSDGASAVINVTRLKTDAEKYYAVFPAACAYTVVDETIEDSFIKNGCIQISTGDILRDKKETFKSYAVSDMAGGNLCFQNIGAIVYFKTGRTDVGSVTFKSNVSGMTMSNALVDPSTGAVTNREYGAAREVEYSLNGATEAFIPVSAGVEFKGGYTLTVYNRSKFILGAISTDSDLTFENGHYYTVKDFDSRLGRIPGKFTVNRDGDQVNFATGNLICKLGAFEFERNQVVCVTRFDQTYVSHFYWNGDAANAYCIDFSGNSGRSLFTDDPDFTVSGLKDVWRTLSSSEWKYILGTEGTQGADFRDVDNRFAEAKVGNVAGLMIFPDDFKWDALTMGLEPMYNIVGDVAFDNVYSADNFAAMEKVGVVFLPTTGCRNGSSIENAGSGYYWAGDFPASSLFFGDVIRPDDQDFYDVGCCIRLVADCQ